MRTLYFDCFAGASGNMILGALIAAGVDVEVLKFELRKLNVSNFELEVETIDRSGISSTHVAVRVPDEQVHRHLQTIEKMIDESNLSEKVKRNSKAIFRRLAEAEAKVHGIEIEKVHFHEVGALDAIIDVVGSCIAFELLGIERFVCSKIHVGSGFVKTAHGKFPVPPPAVAELLKGVPIYSTEVEGELITPTGAAIISMFCDSYGALSEMSVEQTGYGAGTRAYQRFPNALRVFIGETVLDGQKSATRAATSEHLVLLETNIDDLTPQLLGYFMDKAFATGALDCWFTPAQMKKNRPGTVVSVLCEPKKSDALTELMFRETTTIGIRVSTVLRTSVSRDTETRETPFGNVTFKVSKLGETVLNVKPEYEDLRSIAESEGIPMKDLEREIAAAASGDR